MGAALATLTAEGESFSTLQLQMSYFLPVVDGRISAHVRVICSAYPDKWVQMIDELESPG